MRTLGIRAKLVFSSACILIGLGAAVTLYSVSQIRSALYSEMVRRVEAQTLNWIEANTSQIILSGSPQTLDRVVGSLKRQEGITYVILLDGKGHQRAAVGVRQGLEEEGPAVKEPGTSMRWREMKDAEGSRHFELTVPISTSGTGMNTNLESLFGAAAQNPTWGEVRVGVDREEFESSVNALVRKNVALAVALILLAIGLSLVFATQMVTPISLMGRAANQLAVGNLSARVTRGLQLQDEVGDLVRNFNRMAKRLEENHVEMNLLYSGLEEKVQERTQDLEEANRRLHELDQLKSDFLSTVSHELRTPLTSIKAYAELLLDSQDLDSETEKQFLGIIEKETDRMTRLISNFLDLTKIESGTASWMMRESNLGEIVRRSVTALMANAAEKRVELKVTGSGTQPVWVDEDRIQEVVTNLVGNSIKFCPPGSLVEVALGKADTSGPGNALPGSYFVVTVRDTGPGLRPEERGRVFQKFYQGSRSRSAGSGTGLGLAISKEIVMHHRGEIWVESEFGIGSTFYFTLPSLVPSRASESHLPTQQGEEGS